jgi:hypothetical protein
VATAVVFKHEPAHPAAKLAGTVAYRHQAPLFNWRGNAIYPGQLSQVRHSQPRPILMLYYDNLTGKVWAESYKRIELFREPEAHQWAACFYLVLSSLLSLLL